MKSLLIWVFFVVCWVGWVGVNWYSERALQVHVFDVGQGDSILIITPDKDTILVDGGPGDYALRRLGEVLPSWVRSVDIVVLTHPHADHVNGLLDVLDRYDVKEVWVNSVEYGYPGYAVFNEMVMEDGPIVKEVGSEELVLQSGGAVIRELNKEDTRSGSRSSGKGGSHGSGGDLNINNESVVLLIEYGEFKMLLTGDAEHEQEREILLSRYRSMIRGIDVLKAGHHCSKTASSEEFLATVKPKAAICSCGVDNSFGHPHSETLQIFDEMDVFVYRTDQSGTISIYSNGVHWWVE